MERRSAVVSLIVAVPDGRAKESPNCLSVRDEGPGRVRAEIPEAHITGLRAIGPEKALASARTQSKHVLAQLE
jgi:hypothetical protein